MVLVDCSFDVDRAMVQRLHHLVEWTFLTAKADVLNASNAHIHTIAPATRVLLFTAATLHEVFKQLADLPATLFTIPKPVSVVLLESVHEVPPDISEELYRFDDDHITLISDRHQL